MNFKLVSIASVAALFFFSASTVFAMTATCSKATPDKFKPEADLVASLKSQGMTVSKLKTEKGCYEVYAKDASGKKLNMAFNAETLEPVANPEAGEN
jgi:hypothetical protein